MKNIEELKNLIYTVNVSMLRCSKWVIILVCLVGTLVDANARYKKKESVEWSLEQDNEFGNSKELFSTLNCSKLVFGGMTIDELENFPTKKEEALYNATKLYHTIVRITNKESKSFQVKTTESNPEYNEESFIVEIIPEEIKTTEMVVGFKIYKKSNPEIYKFFRVDADEELDEDELNNKERQFELNAEEIAKDIESDIFWSHRNARNRKK